ncbi:MAG: GNAT family N-acetyltransferase, partial [Candidatus Eremiobacteraeota bacterium]|nr:GNAT family N-acetyltransferase [Candidatus Eremiobacteraeota bacterium]
YFRFFVALKNLDPADIRHAVEDRPDLIGFLAEDNERSLGIVHASLLENGSAELSVLVADDARRRGIASALLRATIARLGELGIERIVVYSLSENYAFSKLARSIGLRVERSERSELLWVLAPKSPAEVPARRLPHRAEAGCPVPASKWASS